MEKILSDQCDRSGHTVAFFLVIVPKKLDFPQAHMEDVHSEAVQWMSFYSAQIGSRAPSDLKVLYLCGPEPINDLDIFISLGIIPQNIWAVENQRSLYKHAIDQLQNHNSYIRIHHGNLERFFNTVNDRFDIIYVDACGPLPSSKPNTLRLPISMAENERLAPLGVLITNFAEPGSQDYDRYADLMSQYFAPRYTDFPNVLFEDGVDPEIAKYDVDYLKRYVSRRITDVYSEFITHFFVDLVRNIVPCRRIFANLEIRRKYFAEPQVLKKVKSKAIASPKFNSDMTPQEKIASFFETIGDFHLNPSSYPIATFIQRASKLPYLRRFLEPIIGGNLDGTDPVDALLTIELIEHMIEGHWGAISSEMLMAVQQSWIDKNGGLFCDVPMPNLLVNSLFGIYSHPYFPNPVGSKRIAYIAKSTRMYTDCFLFDQCRYYFDFWPTIDLVPARFQSLSFQLILRTCLDRIGRHDWNSTSHPFRGAALVGFDDITSAKKYEFEERYEEIFHELKDG